MSVTVTMEGKDITEQCYQNGVIYIPVIKGDISIHATATKSPVSYRWEFAGSNVTNITTNGNTANNLEKLGGTITNGVLQDVYFHMTTNVILRHDLPWVVEWSAAGNWSGMILAKKQVSYAEGNIYIFKSNASSDGLVAFGHRISNLYENYGIEPGKHSFDPIKQHTYRLENRIAADKTNAIHLVIDGTDLGSMEQHFHGATTQNTILNWAGGQDFVFSYIGANGHAIKNCDLDYLQIWETKPS